MISSALLSGNTGCSSASQSVGRVDRDGVVTVKLLALMSTYPLNPLKLTSQFFFRYINIHSGEATLQFSILLFFQMEVHSLRKEFAPSGANSFLKELTSEGADSFLK